MVFNLNTDLAGFGVPPAPYDHDRGAEREPEADPKVCPAPPPGLSAPASEQRLVGSTLLEELRAKPQEPLGTRHAGAVSEKQHDFVMASKKITETGLDWFAAPQVVQAASFLRPFGEEHFHNQTVQMIIEATSPTPSGDTDPGHLVPEKSPSGFVLDLKKCPFEVPAELHTTDASQLKEAKLSSKKASDDVGVPASPADLPKLIDVQAAIDYIVAAGTCKWGECTTVMMRNLPCRYSQRRLMTEINGLGFQGRYDFFFLPMDPRSRANRGFAFINFEIPAVSDVFYDVFHGKRLQLFNSDKVISVRPADVQGFEENARYYAHAVAARKTNSTNNRPLFFKPLPEGLLNDAERSALACAAANAASAASPERTEGTKAERRVLKAKTFANQQASPVALLARRHYLAHNQGKGGGDAGYGAGPYHEDFGGDHLALGGMDPHGADSHYWNESSHYTQGRVQLRSAPWHAPIGGGNNYHQNPHAAHDYDQWQARWRGHGQTTHHTQQTALLPDAPQQAQAAPSFHRFCGHCGAEREARQNFCPFCGRRFDV